MLVEVVFGVTITSRSGGGGPNKGRLGFGSVVISFSMTKAAAHHHYWLGGGRQWHLDLPVGAAHLLIELEPQIATDLGLLAAVQVLYFLEVCLKSVQLVE